MIFDDYRALPGINWSTLKHMERSARQCKYIIDHGDDDTTSRGMGRLLHTLVLQPHLFGADYAVFTGTGNRASKAWGAFEAENHGKTLLKADEVSSVQAQAAAVLADPQAAALLRRAVREVPIRWIDPDTGLACKGLLDAVSPEWDMIADLKGCGPLATFERLAFRSGYVHQLAWYRRGVRIAHGVTATAHLIGSECKPAHDVGIFRPSEELLDMCEAECVEWLHAMKRCLESGVWSGRYDSVQPMDIPSWALPDEVTIAGDVGEDEGGSFADL